MSINFSLENGIARIAFNRPEAYNSVNKSLAHEFITALKECSHNDDVRVVLVTGIGKAFCAGQDLKEATDPELMPGFRSLLEEHYRPIIMHMVNLDKPIVTAVNGVAAGAGANIALAGDIIVAHEKASFIQAFSGIGLVPDSGGTFHLPRLVGRSKAMAYCMLGDKVTAKEAERVGMIYKYFADEEYEEGVEAILTRMANMPTTALTLTKELVNMTWNHDLTQQFDLETESQISAANSADYREGVSSFVEKRKPNFTGK